MDRGSPPTTMTTAADALHDEEVVRTRMFLRLAWIVAIAAALAVWVLPGNRDVGRVLLVMIGVTTVGALVLYRHLRKATKVDPRPINVLAVAAILCGHLGILYVGFLSAAPVLVALGLFFLCRTEHRASAIGVFLFASVGHAVIAALIIGRVIHDPGFYPVRADASVQAQIAAVATLEQMYGLCFFFARFSRRASLKSIEQLQKATRLAAVRDAQVNELRMDLDRALKIGGPG